MRSNAETLEGNQVKLTIGIRDDELEPYVDSTVRKLSREVRIPGFRPGKAPRKVLEARLGTKVLRREAIEEALESYYRQALLDNGIDAIAPPSVDISEGEEGGDITVDAVIQTRPVVTVEGFDSLEIEVPAFRIGDEDVSESLRNLQEQFGALKDVDRPIEDGDQVTIDLRVAVDGEVDEAASFEDLSIRVGRRQIDERIESNLLGSRSGETMDVAFSDDPEGLVRSITVKSVKEIELPEPTDEFAAEASEFSTIEELRTDIQTRLSTMRLAMAKNTYRQEVIDKLVELVQPNEVPDPLLSAQVENDLHQFGHQLESQGLTLRRYLELTGQSEPQLLNTVYSGARRSVLLDLALRAIALDRSYEISEEEIDERVEKIVESQPGQAQALREYYQAGENRLALRVDILKQRAFNEVLKTVVIRDTKGEAVELVELDPELADELGE
ncbi:MAG: trigger factor [Acidimicrobiales bacterium]